MIFNPAAYFEMSREELNPKIIYSSDISLLYAGWGGFIVGVKGTHSITYSHNHGESWSDINNMSYPYKGTYVEFNIDKRNNNIYHYNSSSGYSSAGTLSVSKNFGLTFSTITQPSLTNYVLNCYSIHNNIIVAFYYNSSSSEGRLYKSVNGGNTWTLSKNAVYDYIVKSSNDFSRRDIQIFNNVCVAKLRYRVSSTYYYKLIINYNVSSSNTWSDITGGPSSYQDVVFCLSVDGKAVYVYDTVSGYSGRYLISSGTWTTLTKQSGFYINNFPKLAAVNSYQSIIGGNAIAGFYLGGDHYVQFTEEPHYNRLGYVSDVSNDNYYYIKLYDSESSHIYRGFFKYYSNSGSLTLP